MFVHDVSQFTKGVHFWTSINFQSWESYFSLGTKENPLELDLSVLLNFFFFFLSAPSISVSANGKDTRKVAQYSYLRLGSVQLFAKVIVFFRNLESMCLQGSDWTLDLPVQGAHYRWRRHATGLPGTLAPWHSPSLSSWSFTTLPTRNIISVSLIYSCLYSSVFHPTCHLTNPLNVWTQRPYRIVLILS